MNGVCVCVCVCVRACVCVCVRACVCVCVSQPSLVLLYQTLECVVWRVRVGPSIHQLKLQPLPIARAEDGVHLHPSPGC